MTRAPHPAQIPRLKCAGVPMAPLDQTRCAFPASPRRYAVLTNSRAETERVTGRLPLEKAQFELA